MNNTKMLLGLGVVLVVLMMAVSTGIAVSTEKEELKIGSNGVFLNEESITFSDNELDAIYKSYGVTENDVKHFNGELPHWLDGTILGDGGPKVLGYPEGAEVTDAQRAKVDIAMPMAEVQKIWDDARGRYLEKYGVDVNNPVEFEVINEYVLPAEYVKKEMPVEYLLSPSTGDYVAEESMKLRQINPKAVGGEINVYYAPASGDNAPTSNQYSKMSTGVKRLEVFGVDVNVYVYANKWDPGSETNADNLIDDIELFGTSQYNELVMGWVHECSNNGIANIDGPFSVCSETRILGVDWDHDEIAQHELSHNFGAHDEGVVLTPCIMHYLSAYQGVTAWCVHSGNEVDYGLDH